MPVHALRPILPAAAVLLATLLATLFAACAGGTRPRDAVAPSAPATEEVRLAVADAMGYPIQPGTTTARFEQGGATTAVTDNAGGDLDPAVGAIRVRLPRAERHVACLSTASSFQYVRPEHRCRTAERPAGADAVDLGAFVLDRMVRVEAAMLDARRSTGAWEVPVGSHTGTVTFTHVASGAVTTIVNDGLLDQAGSLPGVSRFVHPGVYRVCETEAPAGYALAGPSCVTVDATDATTAPRVQLRHAPARGGRRMIRE